MVSLVGTWGKMAAQDEGSADHGVSGLPVRFSSINKCFQVGKWVANHL